MVLPMDYDPHIYRHITLLLYSYHFRQDLAMRSAGEDMEQGRTWEMYQFAGSALSQWDV